MTRRAIIADYGVGNLRSVARAVAHCGFEPVLATDAATIDAADRLILPGVGAFGSCVAALRDHGLMDAVVRAMDDDRPVLGICVGMQMLLDSSEEFGEHAGLARIPGKVRAIPNTGADGTPHKIPHIGWSPVQPANQDWAGTVFAEIAPGSPCYFVHSFAAQPDDSGAILAQCHYDGVPICAAVRVGNLYGVQFHPEKSGPVGLKVFETFLKTAA